MKRTLLGGLVLALALFVAQVGTSQAAGQNIKYDTYCDGASLTYDALTGIASGSQTGCKVGPMAGTVAQVFAQGAAVTMGYHTTADFYIHGIVTVIRADNTWTHYQNTGAGTVVLNSGTWTPGIAAPAAARGISSMGR